MLAIIPVMIAFGYFLYVSAQEVFRYDEQYFTPSYQEKYNSPGTIARTLEGALQEGNQQLLKELQGIQLGLDLPLWNRYFYWLGQVVRLDFGESMFGEPILDIFKRVIPPTLLVFVIGTILAFMIGLWSVSGWQMWGIDDLAFDIMTIAYIPMVTYILLAFGEFMLIMQASMRDVKNSEYVQIARAKGLPESTVRDQHAARNALLPVLSRLVISLPYLITGVVIIESSVGWPGLGTNLWNALYWQNMPVVMNTLLIVGIISLGARLIIDVIAAYLDPRIRYQDFQTNHT